MVFVRMCYSQPTEARWFMCQPPVPVLKPTSVRSFQLLIEQNLGLGYIEGVMAEAESRHRQGLENRTTDAQINGMNREFDEARAGQLCA